MYLKVNIVSIHRTHADSMRGHDLLWHHHPPFPLTVAIFWPLLLKTLFLQGRPRVF
jgi:hypothetical protein